MPDPFYFDTEIPESGLPLFDSHCHLQFSDYDNDRHEVIERAKQAGLKYLICVSCDLKSAKEAIKLAKENPGYIYATVGNHPYEADKGTEQFERLIEKNINQIVAIGETGLDYAKNKLPKDIQIKSLEQHCELAVKFNLPIIIHTRETEDCYEDAKKILLAKNIKKAIFHCFAGALRTAEDIWNHGWKTSFSLVTTYDKNAELREILQKCPPQYLLRETDSPYLPPKDKRGERNEPSYLEEPFGKTVKKLDNAF